MHQYHLFFRYMMCKETGEMKSKNNPPMEKRLRFSLNCSLWCIENKIWPLKHFLPISSSICITKALEVKTKYKGTILDNKKEN